MSNTFLIRLVNKLNASYINDYNDNYDELRFGPFSPSKSSAIQRVLDIYIKPRYVSKNELGRLTRQVDNKLHELKPYIPKLENLYDLLGNQESRNLMVDILAYKILGYKKVKLPVNNSQYRKMLEKCQSLEDKENYIDVNFNNWRLGFFSIKDLGYDISLYFTSMGILIDFVLEQYKYQSSDKTIEVKKDDVVIDAGGCWGDTALYFASKVGANGKVYTYEFIPKNLNILKKNLSLNPELSPRVEVIENPVWNEDNKKVYYIDNGPGSKVSFEKLNNSDGEAYTKSIDTLVKEKNIQRVDFIKMDIEGAEPYALKGAEQTIKKFRPNLAIASYHSHDDFVNIPEYINSLDLGYKLYMGHYTIHQEETVIFATIH